MSALLVRGLTKRFSGVTALDGADLDVPVGELVAVLGPSGCGKTTLLRCVAGFERADAGTIEVDGRDVTRLAAHRRRIAVVPQEGALFPHLSVAGNVAYGVSRRARGSGRVDEVLVLMGLDRLSGRMPHELSGGQQQRVAVARALAPRPPLVLLDEAFSALDAALRVEVRRFVREALRADGATAILVTHDQDEALSVADRIAVMRDGRIVQAGPPATVYREPADPWVAAFVGEAVLIPATIIDGVARTALGTHPASGTGTVVLVRPEQIELAPAANGPAPAGQVTATVTARDFHGHDALLTLRLEDGTAVVARTMGAGVEPGARTALRVRGAVRAFPGPMPEN